MKDSSLILTGTVILYKNSPEHSLTRSIRRLLSRTQHPANIQGGRKTPTPPSLFVETELFVSLRQSFPRQEHFCNSFHSSMWYLHLCSLKYFTVLPQQALKLEHVKYINKHDPNKHHEPAEYTTMGYFLLTPGCLYRASLPLGYLSSLYSHLSENCLELKGWLKITAMVAMINVCVCTHMCMSHPIDKFAPEECCIQ